MVSEFSGRVKAPVTSCRGCWSGTDYLWLEDTFSFYWSLPEPITKIANTSSIAQQPTRVGPSTRVPGRDCTPWTRIVCTTLLGFRTSGSSWTSRTSNYKVSTLNVSLITWISTLTYWPWNRRHRYPPTCWGGFVATVLTFYRRTSFPQPTLYWSTFTRTTTDLRVVSMVHLDSLMHQFMKLEQNHPISTVSSQYKAFMRRRVKSYPLHTPEYIQTTLIVHTDYRDWQGRESRLRLVTSPCSMEGTTAPMILWLYTMDRLKALQFSASSVESTVQWLSSPQESTYSSSL